MVEMVRKQYLNQVWEGLVQKDLREFQCLLVHTLQCYLELWEQILPTLQILRGPVPYHSYQVLFSFFVHVKLSDVNFKFSQEGSYGNHTITLFSKKETFFLHCDIKFKS